MVNLVAATVSMFMVGAASAQRTMLQAATPVEECPIKPDQTPLDFSKVAASCDLAKNPKEADFCSACVCSLVDSYGPAFKAANVSLTGDVDIDAAATVIKTCTQDYFTSMLMADVNLTALEKLSTCDFTGTGAPTCLSSTAAPATAAASREEEFFKDDAAAAVKAQPAGPLAIAAVQPVQGSAFVKLNGQANSVQELITILLANPDVKGAMAAEDVAAMEKVLADPAKLAAVPKEVLTNLSNPMDVKMFAKSLTSSSAAAAAGPADSAAAAPKSPSPAPAKKNSAASAVLSALPMVGSTMVAVAMLASML